MRVCLFEDHGVLDLEPLTLTRPVFELLCGLTSLGDKQCRFFSFAETGFFVRPESQQSMVLRLTPALRAICSIGSPLS